MEKIKPQDIMRGMVIVDEVNESAYTVLEVYPHEMTVYVLGLALTTWGSLIEHNTTYLYEDADLYVIARPAPFVLDLLPSRAVVQGPTGEYDAYKSDDTTSRIRTLRDAVRTETGTVPALTDIRDAVRDGISTASGFTRRQSKSHD